jgi:Phosphoribosyl transferase (PRTase)/PELOTA RNA binding domain
MTTQELVRNPYRDHDGNWNFSGTYPTDDVVFLLNPKQIKSTPVAEKEALIQSGLRHYSEMLSAESLPDERYMQLYETALSSNAARLRHDIEQLAQAVQRRPKTSESCVVISLARAGTPIGILLKRALERLGIETWHYSISIIRGRGVDKNALDYIAKRHGTENSIFVDGWTGKGAIRGELDRSLENSAFAPFLAVVADPAGRADLAATFDDYVIPSGLLNGIVSGLVSRSVLNDNVVGPNDFHACVYNSEHASDDVSREFIAAIERAGEWDAVSDHWNAAVVNQVRAEAERMIQSIAAECGVDDLNRIKPGIAEATRAILRRVPDRIYVHRRDDPDVAHICLLADKAGLPVIEKNMRTYRAITIIKNLAGDQQ